MSAAHNILSKCDRALVAYLISRGAGTSADVYPAKRSLDKTLPDTICHCDTAKEDPLYSGNYLVTGTINVRSQAAIDDPGNDPDQPLNDADLRVAASFDAFHVELGQAGDTLGEIITAAAVSAGVLDVTILNCSVKTIQAGLSDKGSVWIDTLMVELYAAPKTIDG